MKQLIFLVFILSVMGCSNIATDKEASTPDISETVEASVSTTVAEDFPYATITQQKLQEYIDLRLLKQKHPELASSFDSQIRELMKDSLEIPKEQDSLVVKNLLPLAPFHKVNDSLQQQKFSYTLASKTVFKTDTLTVNISRKPRNIHGENVVLTSIQFSKH